MAFPSPSTIRAVLRGRIDAARENLHLKRAEFDALVEAIQQGLAADTDGAKRIRDAGFEVTAAREALMEALSEFNEYLKNRVVPEHLQSGETAADG